MLNLSAAVGSVAGAASMRAAVLAIEKRTAREQCPDDTRVLVGDRYQRLVMANQNINGTPDSATLTLLGYGVASLGLGDYPLQCEYSRCSTHAAVHRLVCDGNWS